MPSNAPCSAAGPAAITSIDQESIRQKTSDLERTGRGGQLEHVVGRVRPFCSGFVLCPSAFVLLPIRHSYASILTRSPPSRDFNRHGAPSIAALPATQSPQPIFGRHDVGSSIAKCVRDRHENGISIATADARQPRSEQSSRHDRYVIATIAAFQPPRHILACYDEGISIATARIRSPRYGNPIATVRTRSPRSRHFNHHDRYSTATTAAFQPPRYILGGYDCSISMTKSQARSPQYRHSHCSEAYARDLLFLALVRRPSIARPTACASAAGEAQHKIAPK